MFNGHNEHPAITETMGFPHRMIQWDSPDSSGFKEFGLHIQYWIQIINAGYTQTGNHINNSINDLND